MATVESAKIHTDTLPPRRVPYTHTYIQSGRKNQENENHHRRKPVRFGQSYRTVVVVVCCFQH